MKTTIVTGVPGGGTTCIARVVNALGVPMATDTLAAMEDVEFNDHIVNGRWSQVEEKILAMNRNYPQGWGFKRPLLFGHLWDRFDLFESPRLIYVMRDAVSVQASIQRQGHQSEDGLILVAEEQVRMAHLIPTVVIPYLFVSYEAMMTRTNKTVQIIASFLGAGESKLTTAESEVILNDPRYQRGLPS